MANRAALQPTRAEPRRRARATDGGHDSRRRGKSEGKEHAPQLILRTCAATATRPNATRTNGANQLRQVRGCQDSQSAQGTSADCSSSVPDRLDVWSDDLEIDQSCRSRRRLSGRRCQLRMVAGPQRGDVHLKHRAQQGQGLQLPIEGDRKREVVQGQIPAAIARGSPETPSGVEGEEQVPHIWRKGPWGRQLCAFPATT